MLWYLYVSPMTDAQETGTLGSIYFSLKLKSKTLKLKSKTLIEYQSEQLKPGFRLSSD